MNKSFNKKEFSEEVEKLPTIIRIGLEKLGNNIYATKVERPEFADSLSNILTLITLMAVEINASKEESKCSQCSNFKRNSF